ncbi:MAG TPA: hypothetical protein VF773_19890 [Verrucomicrobiae bacterium]
MEFAPATFPHHLRDNMICREGKPFCPIALTLMGAGWFLVALFIGETELLYTLPGPAAQITLIALTTGLLTAFWTSRSFRTWVDQLDLRILVGLHLIRFVGIYFLVLHKRGELPGRFAVTAGWGDIIVAVGALALLVLPPLLKSSKAVFLWNTLGLADILLVVTTAAGISFVDRESMSALTRLPLSFLPTMVVPLIITTHVVVMIRILRRAERRAVSVVPDEQAVPSF